MNESQWQSKVDHLLDLYGWSYYHTHDSRRSRAGFLDLCAVRRGRLIFAELKQDGKYPTPDQRMWLADLHEAGQEVAVWRPRDLAVVLQCLGPAARPLELEVRYRTMDPKERLQILAKQRSRT